MHREVAQNRTIASSGCQQLPEVSVVFLNRACPEGPSVIAKIGRRGRGYLCIRYVFAIDGRVGNQDGHPFGRRLAVSPWSTGCCWKRISARAFEKDPVSQNHRTVECEARF